MDVSNAEKLCFNQVSAAYHEIMRDAKEKQPCIFWISKLKMKEAGVSPDKERTHELPGGNTSLLEVSAFDDEVPFRTSLTIKEASAKHGTAFQSIKCVADTRKGLYDHAVISV